jgi:hypothetical protein
MVSKMIKSLLIVGRLFLLRVNRAPTLERVGHPPSAFLRLDEAVMKPLANAKSGSDPALTLGALMGIGGCWLFDKNGMLA